MSTERDELAEDIRSLGITVIDGPPVDLTEPLAQHLHNLGYRKPRTITTTEELDALHESAILRSRGGDAFQRGEDFHQRKGWFMNGTVDPLTTKQVAAFGPFTVLHEGSAS